MTTPLSDPDNVMFFVVDNYVAPSDGFTDDEVQRILNGQPLDAVVASVESFHLPGKHDQDKHGDGGKSSKTTSQKSGKPLKITHMLVHGKHEPGKTIAVTSDGKKRARWDGKQYELQQKQDDGTWSTEQTAIKSKAYKAINAYASDWEEPAAESVDSTPSSEPEVAPKPEPKVEPSVKPPTKSKPQSTATSTLLQAYNDGYVVEREFTAGLSGSKVELLTLSNGDMVVRKTAPESTTLQGNTSRQEYLAGRVFSALSDDESDNDVVTARVNDNAIITTYVKGDTGAAVTGNIVGANPLKIYGSKAKANAAVNAETKRQVQLSGGKKIGMLDWLTRNNDRHNLNWIVDGNDSGDETVKPIDQGYAFYVQEIADAEGKKHELVPNSPFVDYWLNPKMNGFTSVVRPKFTKAELSQYRTALEGLESEFASEGASEWYSQMMARFAKVETAVKK